MPDQPAQSPSARVVFAWGAFLACSWTWCIGMYLPGLLWRDYGPWSFLAFAVPNILGAAALAWVIRDPHASRRFIARHRLACRVFSLATIAFQVFFASWLSISWAGPWGGAVALALSAAGVMLAGRGDQAWRVLAVGLWGLSAGAALTLWAGGSLEPVAIGPQDPSGLVGLIPVSLLGFALCPYLDLTFHRVRRRTARRPGRAAFALGFGVLFATLILFTTGYAGLLPELRDPSGPAPSTDPRAAAPASGVLALVYGHIVLQLLFTVGAHAREIRPAARSSWALAAAAVGGIAVAAGLAPLAGYAGLSIHELVYRLFMSLYGLVFPAYVWICALPASSPTRRQAVTAALAVTLAAPLYWLAFIERDMLWAIPGVAIVLASGVLERRLRASGPVPITHALSPHARA